MDTVGVRTAAQREDVAAVALLALESARIAVWTWRLGDDRLRWWGSTDVAGRATRVRDLDGLFAVVDSGFRSQLVLLVHAALVGGSRRPVRVSVEGGGRWLECGCHVVERAGEVVKVIGGWMRDVTAEELALRESRTQAGLLRSLARSVVQAQEEERRATALTLHDEIGQKVTAAAMRVARHGEECNADLRCVEESLTGILSDVRRLAADLRPAMLDDLGLRPALERLVEGQRIDGCARIELDAEAVAGRRYAPAVEVAAYRIVQEASTNALRHARAGNISISAAVEGDPDRGVLHVTVQDDGIGFSAVSDGDAVGLLGMQERAAAVGGAVSILARAGVGTTVTARLPLDENGAASL